MLVHSDDLLMNCRVNAIECFECFSLKPGSKLLPKPIRAIATDSMVWFNEGEEKVA